MWSSLYKRSHPPLKPWRRRSCWSPKIPITFKQSMLMETKWRQDTSSLVVWLNILNIDKETSIKDSWFRHHSQVMSRCCSSGLYLKWENSPERNLLPRTQNRQNRNSLTLSVQWFLLIFNISFISATPSLIFLVSFYKMQWSEIVPCVKKVLLCFGINHLSPWSLYL